MDGLPPIPAGTAITDPQGRITTFFRLRWQNLIDGFTQTPNKATIALLDNQTAAIATANAFVTLNAGWYRLTYYLRKTIADGVSSSAQVTIGWTDHAQAMTKVFAALTTDAVTAFDSQTLLVYCDASAALTYAVAYASNTPAKMAFILGVTVELMG